jgi:hypothetical protein
MFQRLRAMGRPRFKCHINYLVTSHSRDFSATKTGPWCSELLAASIGLPAPNDPKSDRTNEQVVV